MQHPFSGHLDLSDSVFQAPLISPRPIVRAISTWSNKKIEDLTEMMRSLTLSVRTLQGKANVLQPVQPPKPLPSKPIPPATSQPGSFFPNATFEPRTRTIGYRK